jgi:hypothetical protein
MKKDTKRRDKKVCRKDKGSDIVSLYLATLTFE